MKDNLKKINDKLNSKFYFDYDMSKHVWFRAGGKASVFCIVYDIKELQIILNEIKDFPYEVIGCGSNFLIRDIGYEGIIIKLGKNFNKIHLCDGLVNVGASILDTNLAKFAEINNFTDFEFYSGIPGSVGGAITMNAGCYGSETKDIIKEVEFINKKGELKILKNSEINFEYRSSNLPKNSIIISAKYNCKHGKKEEIIENKNKIKKIRLDSQPIKSKTSGSTFKNPKGNFAAKLIDQAGCKGIRIGDALVSEKHANFLINIDKATAKEIEDLGNVIIEKVYNKFNIKLEWEVKIIG